MTLDPGTGAATVVGALGFGNVQGLGFDRSNHVLYGTDSTARRLIRIDTSTGAGTSVGSTRFAVYGLGERLD